MAVPAYALEDLLREVLKLCEHAFLTTLTVTIEIG
jgi:hypothetical protein